MGATEKMLKIAFFTIQSYFKHCSYYNLVQELHLNSIEFNFGRLIDFKQL